MKARELREFSVEELQHKQQELIEELFNLRFQLATGQIENVGRHPIYERVVKRSKKFHAHDEHNQCQIGDIVRIIETRPLSKTKCWRLLEVVRRRAGAHVAPLAGREELSV
jgi:small subunit ribosomal protein S17